MQNVRIGVVSDGGNKGGYNNMTSEVYANTQFLDMVSDSQKAIDCLLLIFSLIGRE